MALICRAAALTNSGGFVVIALSVCMWALLSLREKEESSPTLTALNKTANGHVGFWIRRAQNTMKRCQDYDWLQSQGISPHSAQHNNVRQDWNKWAEDINERFAEKPPVGGKR
jgi:hypothetical protein